MTEEKKPERSSSEAVALRNNWLKIFVVATVTIVLSVKFWTADFSAALSSFEFSDLLALFLALFSIALSVLFYLKATETSNVFYDNTYRFTKDVAEILGRVEAGFGEKLAHLDEGYAGLRTAVENIPFDRTQAEKEIEEEEQEVQRVEAERDQLIEGILERARLDGEERERLRGELQAKDEELITARRELAMTRKQMSDALAEERLGAMRQDSLFESVMGGRSSGAPRSFLTFARNIPPEAIKYLSTSDIDELWKSVLDGRHPHPAWKRAGLVDRDGKLTDIGRETITTYHKLSVAD